MRKFKLSYLFSFIKKYLNVENKENCIEILTIFENNLVYVFNNYIHLKVEDLVSFFTKIDNTVQEKVLTNKEIFKESR